MILTAHQPAYLPWLGLLHKIAQADTFVLFDDTQFCPNDWQHRNRILTPQGPLLLTVPIRNSESRSLKIKDAEIAGDHWRRKHWRSLEATYRKAPHWPDLSRFLTDHYAQPWTRLVPLCEAQLRWLCGHLGLPVRILRASDFAFQGTKSALVLDMCRQLGATEYLFGAQGRNYADVPAFEAAGICVRFDRFTHPVYPQQHSQDFVPNLSAIDMLANVGWEGVRAWIASAISR